MSSNTDFGTASDRVRNRTTALPEGIVPPEEQRPELSQIEEPLRVESIRPVFVGASQLEQIEKPSQGLEQTPRARPTGTGAPVTFTGVGGEGTSLRNLPGLQLQPLSTEPTTAEVARELARRGFRTAGRFAGQFQRGASQLQARRIRQTYTPPPLGISSADRPSIFVDQERHAERHLGDERHGDVFTHPSGMIGYATGDIIEGQEVHETGPGDQPLDEHKTTSFTDYGPYYELHPVDEDYDIWTGFHVPKVDHDIRDNYDIYTGWHGQRAKNDKKSFLDIPFPGELDQLEYERDLEEKRARVGLPPSASVVNADYVGGRTMPELSPPISEPLVEQVPKAPQMLPASSEQLPTNVANRLVSTATIPQSALATPNITANTPLAPGTIVSPAGAEATGLTGEDLPSDIKARIAASGGVDFYRVVGRNYVLRSKIPLKQTRLIKTQYGSQKARRPISSLGAIERAQETASLI